MDIRCGSWLLLFVSVLALGLRTTDAVKKSPKIVGGTVASISSMQYLVNLRRSRTFACGGALVSPRFVVTAAHCVYGYPTSVMSVHGGTTYLNRSNVIRRVSRVFIPARFSLDTLNNDVAVLKLRSPMTGRNIDTIPLCSHSLRAGQQVRVSGWGIRNENSATPSNRLRTAMLRLRSATSCRRRYGRASISNSMMCAYAANTDTCSGDSGGPVVSRGQLCGVVSWGYGCARRNYPGVYTNINRVKSFIERSMRR